MTPDDIKKQIIDASGLYAARVAFSKTARRGIQAAYLSGVSQMANFMAGNDGIAGVTAQNVMTAVSLAGAELGISEEPGKGRKG